MTKPSDFADAHTRHWQDAELLFAHDRWANADQLYGLSAECGLKAVMQVLGMPSVDETGKPATEYRKHVNALWLVFQDFANNHDGARYLEMLPPGSPFSNWAIDDRYANRNDFRKEDVELHRAATQEIASMVSGAA